MRFVYIFLAYLIAPLWIGALALRGFRDKTHWRGFSQRFGLGPTVQGRSIWVHAVSVGEVQAAVPLVEALLARFPQIPLVLTTVTPTGRARAEAIFKNRVDVRYVPIDWPGSVRRFFQRAQPQLAVILETEIWPNLYQRCGTLGIPLVLIAVWAFLQAALKVATFILTADQVFGIAGGRAALLKNWIATEGFLETSANLLLLNGLLLIGTIILWSAWMALWLAWNRNQTETSIKGGVT